MDYSYVHFFTFLKRQFRRSIYTFWKVFVFIWRRKKSESSTRPLTS